MADADRAVYAGARPGRPSRSTLRRGQPGRSVGLPRQDQLCDLSRCSSSRATARPRSWPSRAAALQAALHLCAYALYQLHPKCPTNAAELQQAVGRYAGVADGAEVPGCRCRFHPATAPGGGGPPQPDPPSHRLMTGRRAAERVRAEAVADAGGWIRRGGAGAPCRRCPTSGPTPQPGSPSAPAIASYGPAPAPPLAAAPIAGMPAPGGAAGALASVVGPLAGLVTGIALAAGQRAAAADESGDDDDSTDGEETTKPSDEAEDSLTAGPGHGETERAPVGARPTPSLWAAQAVDG